MFDEGYIWFMIIKLYIVGMIILDIFKTIDKYIIICTYYIIIFVKYISSNLVQNTQINV